MEENEWFSVNVKELSIICTSDTDGLHKFWVPGYPGD
jgi:hypothetical protein